MTVSEFDRNRARQLRLEASSLKWRDPKSTVELGALPDSREVLERLLDAIEKTFAWLRPFIEADAQFQTARQALSVTLPFDVLEARRPLELDLEAADAARQAVWSEHIDELKGKTNQVTIIFSTWAEIAERLADVICPAST